MATEDDQKDLDQQDQEKDQDGSQDQDQKDQDQDGSQDQKDQDQKDQEKDLDPEVKKAIRRRDAAVAARQKAEEEVRRLKEKYEPEKADPVKVANRRLVTAEARVVMTAASITDPEDQKALATFLDLDSVTVDDDGTVDSDTIQERLERLAAIFGKTAKKDQKRTPRTDSRDRGGEKATPKDAAAARRQAMLMGR